MSRVQNPALTVLGAFCVAAVLLLPTPSQAADPRGHGAGKPSTAKAGQSSVRRDANPRRVQFRLPPERARANENLAAARDTRRDGIRLVSSSAAGPSGSNAAATGGAHDTRRDGVRLPSSPVSGPSGSTPVAVPAGPSGPTTSGARDPRRQGGRFVVRLSSRGVPTSFESVQSDNLSVQSNRPASVFLERAPL
jgi:hypothetical protein